MNRKDSVHPIVRTLVRSTGDRKTLFHLLNIYTGVHTRLRGTFPSQFGFMSGQSCTSCVCLHSSLSALGKGGLRPGQGRLGGFEDGCPGCACGPLASSLVPTYLRLRAR